MTDLSVVIAVLGLALSVATFFFGRQSAAHGQGREAGNVTTDIQYIKGSVERIENRLTNDVSRLEGRIDEQTNQMAGMAEIAARAHESAKSAHRRVNEHLTREHNMKVVQPEDTGHN